MAKMKTSKKFAPRFIGQVYYDQLKSVHERMLKNYEELLKDHEKLKVEHNELKDHHPLTLDQVAKLLKAVIES